MRAALVVIPAIALGLATPPVTPPVAPLPGLLSARTAATAAEDYMDVTGNRSDRQHAEEQRQATWDGREWRSVYSIGCTQRDGTAVPDVDGLCADGLPLVAVMFCDESEWAGTGKTCDQFPHDGGDM